MLNRFPRLLKLIAVLVIACLLEPSGWTACLAHCRLTPLALAPSGTAVFEHAAITARLLGVPNRGHFWQSPIKSLGNLLRQTAKDDPRQSKNHLDPRLSLLRSFLASISLTLRTGLRRWENPRRRPSISLELFPEPQRVERLYQLTRPKLNRTPLLEAETITADLRQRLGRKDMQVLVKYEPDQQTGAYKPRGVLADVVSHALRVWREQGSLSNIVWVTESTGNHGRALAWSVSQLPDILERRIGRRLGKDEIGTVEVYVPGDPPIPDAKRQALLSFQHQVNLKVIDGERRHGRFAYFRSYGKARAAVLARRREAKVIHVEHDSPNVMAGHAGVLLEIGEQLAERGLLDVQHKLKVPVTVIAPAGSYGMVAGIAMAARAYFGEGIRVVAAQSTNIRGGVLSLIFGFIIRNRQLTELVPEDGTAVDRIGPRAFRVFRRLGDAAVIVRDVKHGVRVLYQDIKRHTAGKPFEGSVGNAVEALYEYPEVVDSLDGRHEAGVVVLLLSGGNVDNDMWADMTRPDVSSQAGSLGAAQYFYVRRQASGEGRSKLRRYFSPQDFEHVKRNDLATPRHVFRSGFYSTLWDWFPEFDGFLLKAPQGVLDDDAAEAIAGHGAFTEWCMTNQKRVFDAICRHGQERPDGFYAPDHVLPGFEFLLHGRPGFVVPYLKGENPFQRFVRGPIHKNSSLPNRRFASLSQYLLLGVAMANAISALNALGFVHGDINPEQFILPENATASNAILIDYERTLPIGAMRPKGEEWSSFTGAMGGFRPPHWQEKARLTDDVYGLAATLAWLWRGERLYVQGVMDAKYSTEGKAIASRNLRAPDYAMWQDFEKLLEGNPIRDEILVALGKPILGRTPYTSVNEFATDIRARLRAIRPPQGSSSLGAAQQFPVMPVPSPLRGAA